MDYSNDPKQPYDPQEFEKLILACLDNLAPHGHPDFNDIVLSIAKLHSDKNHDYARGGDPLGNFKRSAEILGKYWQVFATIEGPAILALMYSMKQIDAVLWSLSQGGENVCEGIEGKLKDMAVYALLTLIMVAEAKKVHKEIEEFPYIVMANETYDRSAPDSSPYFPLLKDPCPCPDCEAARGGGPGVEEAERAI